MNRRTFLAVGGRTVALVATTARVEGRVIAMRPANQP